MGRWQKSCRAEDTRILKLFVCLDSSVALAAGSHAITVNGIGWDGTHQTKSFTLSVSSTSNCAAPSAAGVNVCSPVNGSSVSSPVSVRAAAKITGTFARMEIWVDGVKKYTETTGTSLQYQPEFASGLSPVRHLRRQHRGLQVGERRDSYGEVRPSSRDRAIRLASDGPVHLKEAFRMGHSAGFFIIELLEMWHHCTGGFT